MLGRLFGKRKQVDTTKPAKSGADTLRNAAQENSGRSDSAKSNSARNNTSRSSTGRNSSNRNSSTRNNSNRSRSAQDSSAQSNSAQGNSTSSRSSSSNRNGRRRNQPRRDNPINHQDEKTSQPEAVQSNASTNQKEQSQSSHSSASRNTHKRVSAPAKPWDINEFSVPVVEGKTRFHDLDLPLEVMHAISDLGFEYCSPIQAQSLPFALNSQDVVGKAQTGTGKTAAFLLAIIDDLIKSPLKEQRYAGEARALILAPTRELVIQIAEDAKLLTKYTGLEVHALVGGMDYQKQQRDMQNRLVDILVATPGRLMDFCSNQDVFLDQVEVLVIDEADRMLDMGFIPQIRRILGQTPKKTQRQTLLFSATFTDDVLNLVEQWTVDPITVEIKQDSVATDTVTQYVYLAVADEKYTLLYNILNQPDVESLIVFSNRRDECRHLYECLKAHGFAVGLLSGEINQNQRVKTLDGFKSGKIKVLVATDVAGRGIHIDGISHVVNLTLPEEPEDYVHRIGRTGRAGKSGTSISFACEDDAFRLMPIQELVGSDLKCTQPPEELLAAPPVIDMPKKERQRRPSGNRPSGNRNGGRSGGNRSR